VTGEGGSGGALALGVADRVLMLEHAVYSVISPEGCAAILWEDARKARDAAEVLRLTASDLLKLGVVDAVIGEPPGGAHRDWDATAAAIRPALRAALAQLRGLPAHELLQQRYAKFRRMGVFEETL
jgi:acetyl-CoA carboxylase carboxyl transferase subunit alpha